MVLLATLSRNGKKCVKLLPICVYVQICMLDLLDHYINVDQFITTPSCNVADMRQSNNKSIQMRNTSMQNAVYIYGDKQINRQDSLIRYLDI